MRAHRVPSLSLVRVCVCVHAPPDHPAMSCSCVSCCAGTYDSRALTGHRIRCREAAGVQAQARRLVAGERGGGEGGPKSCMRSGTHCAVIARIAGTLIVHSSENDASVRGEVVLV